MSIKCFFGVHAYEQRLEPVLEEAGKWCWTPVSVVCNKCKDIQYLNNEKAFSKYQHYPIHPAYLTKDNSI